MCVAPHLKSFVSTFESNPTFTPPLERNDLGKENNEMAGMEAGNRTRAGGEQPTKKCKRCKEKDPVVVVRQESLCRFVLKCGGAQFLFPNRS